MNITIFRRRFTPWGVDGTLVINGVYFTGTVEHPKKFLPAGRYKIAPVPIKIVEEVRTMPTILQEKGRVSKKPVIRKPYLKPGFGPFERVTLVIKNWGKDDIPKEYMVVLPNHVPANNTPANNNPQ